MITFDAQSIARPAPEGGLWGTDPASQAHISTAGPGAAIRALLLVGFAGAFRRSAGSHPL